MTLDVALLRTTFERALASTQSLASTNKSTRSKVTI